MCFLIAYFNDKMLVFPFVFVFDLFHQFCVKLYTN